MKWVVRGSGEPRDLSVERTDGRYRVTVAGREVEVDMTRLDGANVASLRFVEDGRSFRVSFQRAGARGWRVAVGEREFEFEVLTPVEAIEAIAAAEASGPSQVTAPIPGKVVAVQVSEGDTVEPGQPLVVLEAMKMENELAAEGAGTVAAVHVASGDTVEAGAVLVEIE